MIERAKGDLFVARCFYAGVPFGAVAGFFLAKLAGMGASPWLKAVDSNLHRMQTGAAVTAFDHHDGGRCHFGSLKAPPGSGAQQTSLRLIAAEL